MDNIIGIIMYSMAVLSKAVLSPGKLWKVCTVKIFTAQYYRIVSPPVCGGSTNSTQ